RVEAETMNPEGYKEFAPASWEGASGGKGVICPEPLQSCAAETKFEGSDGQYDIAIEYFDVNEGVAHFKLIAGDKTIDQWDAADHLPGNQPSADSSVRRKIPSVLLHPGETIRLESVPDSSDRAAFDYIDISPISPQ